MRCPGNTPLCGRWRRPEKTRVAGGASVKDTSRTMPQLPDFSDSPRKLEKKTNQFGVYVDDEAMIRITRGVRWLKGEPPRLEVFNAYVLAALLVIACRELEPDVNFEEILAYCERTNG